LVWRALAARLAAARRERPGPGPNPGRPANRPLAGESYAIVNGSSNLAAGKGLDAEFLKQVSKEVTKISKDLIKCTFCMFLKCFHTFFA
jgi:hypothetical protein